MWYNFFGDNMKKTEQYDFEIDYDMFTTEEIVRIYNFYKLVIRFAHNHLHQEEVLAEYEIYRKIINNKALEKKYDKNFETKTGISIYHLIKSIKEN